MSNGGFNSSVTIPNTVTKIGDGFLADLQYFNQPITLPSSLTEIGNRFLSSCYDFNQPITIPSSVTTIGSRFMNQCFSFNQPFSLPNSITSIGNGFFGNANNMVSTINLGSLSSSVIEDDGEASTMQISLCAFYPSATAYTTGMTITGTYANDWKTKFPDFATGQNNACRKLLVA